MAYHVYHTDALILESRPFGEGDRILHCYTRELGLIVAHAKSLREMRSRLRYSLQPLARAEVDLIHGKRGWKLISASPVNLNSSILEHGRKRTIFAQHAQLIRRLIQGEERHELLFDDILDAINFLEHQVEEDEFQAAELLFVVRILSRLGYWDDKEEFKILLAPQVWKNDDGLELVKKQRSRVISAVNLALRETQL